MLGLSSAAAAIAILILLIILGYTIFNGIAYFNLDFLTHAASTGGRTGRRNAK